MYPPASHTSVFFFCPCDGHLQGDRGLPGEIGAPGDRGAGEPGPKVNMLTSKADSITHLPPLCIVPFVEAV